MAKFKVGDRVRCLEHNDTGTVLEDSSVPIVLHDHWAKGNGDSGREWAQREVELGRIIGWTNLQTGDILIDDNGGERRVLGTAGEAIFMTYDIPMEEADPCYYTARELQNKSWKIKGAESTDLTELSIAELEEKLGIASGTLRVKKD